MGIESDETDESPEGWEIVPDPLGQGRGWTAVRLLEDEQGAYEEWCGEFFPTKEYCWQAITLGLGSFAETQPSSPVDDDEGVRP